MYETTNEAAAGAPTFTNDRGETIKPGSPGYSVEAIANGLRWDGLPIPEGAKIVHNSQNIPVKPCEKGYAEACENPYTPYEPPAEAIVLPSQVKRDFHAEGKYLNMHGQKIMSNGRVTPPDHALTEALGREVNELRQDLAELRAHLGE